MLATLIGSLGGGLFRMFPEILNFFDRKENRKHELALLELQSTIKKEELDSNALIEATKAQAVTSGVMWVDGLSHLMRPLITFWWVIIMYSVSLVAQFMLLLDAGNSPTETIMQLWGADEKAIVASIISFWFVDRSLRKK